MARLLAIDYGEKRTGIAVTDELQLIASGLTTVTTNKLFLFLENYLLSENVEKVIIGYPKTLQNTKSQATLRVEKFVQVFKKKYNIPIELIDERFTSKMAFQTMIDSGLSKKKRQNKALIDEISATIILQSYMAQ